MANIVSISQKIARNAQVLGYTVSAQGEDSFGNATVTITSDSGSLTIYYLTAAIQLPMGGVLNTVSPYLGIGVGNPGQILIASSASTAGAISDIITGPISANIMAMCAGFANDLVLANSQVIADRSDSDSSINGLPASVGGAGAAYWVRVRGSVDLLGMGQ